MKSSLIVLPGTGESNAVEKEIEEVRMKPNMDIRLSDLKLVLGPELRIVYPLILNFAISGELELDGMAHPKYLKPKGILTFENGDVNLVATQVLPNLCFFIFQGELISIFSCIGWLTQALYLFCFLKHRYA